MAVHKYLIGIGGSGAKSVEALVHLAGSGCFTSAEPVNLAMIDPDKNNWNLKTLTVALQDYQKVRGMLGETQLSNQLNIDQDQSQWFGAAFKSVKVSRNQKSETFEKLVWSPVAHDRTTLEQLMKTEGASESEIQLMDVLYSNEELKERLEFGFKGHPAIGSLLFAKEFNPELEFSTGFATEQINQDNYWSKFCGQQSEIGNIIADGTDIVRIMVVGSVFGGTGAAGVPTIVKKLNDLYKDPIREGRVELGLVLLLPYFKFQKEKDGMLDGQLCAESDEFILNSKYALQYYTQSNVSSYVSQIYVVGNSDYEKMDFAVGGVMQKNKALMTETIAALGISEFFRSNRQADNSRTGEIVFARRSSEVAPDINRQELVSFSEIPNYNRFKSSTLQFTRFAMAAVRHLNRGLKVFDNTALRKTESWFTVYFPEMKTGLFKKATPESVKTDLSSQFKTVTNYLNRYLTWATEILEPVAGVKTENVTRFIQAGDEPDNFDFKDVADLQRSLKWRSVQNAIKDSKVRHSENNMQQFCQAVMDAVKN